VLLVARLLEAYYYPRARFDCNGYVQSTPGRL